MAVTSSTTIPLDVNMTTDIYSTMTVSAEISVETSMDIYTTIIANMTFELSASWENCTTMDVISEKADDKATVSRAAIIIAEVVAIFCAVFGFAGNLFTFITILITPKLKQNANNVFVCNLSVADALYCGLTLPWQIAILHTGHWMWSETFCAWLAGLKYAIFGASLLSLCAIALNRYIHVCYPHYRARVYTRPKIAAMLVTCWCIPLIVNILAVVGIWGEYSYQEIALSCTFGELENASTDSHRIFVYASGLGIPILFMTFCYIRIGLVFYRSRKKMRHWSNSQLPSGRTTQHSSLQLTISMLVIFVVFVLCIGPSTIVGIVDHQMQCKDCHLVTSMFSWIQITLNPIIYTITNSQFQEAYRSLLRRIISCRDCLRVRHCKSCLPCKKCRFCGSCFDGLSRPTSTSSSSTPSSQVNITHGETSA